MTNLNNVDGRKPGFVRLVHPENGSKIYMPNIMMMNDEAVLEFITVIEEITAAEAESKKKKEQGDRDNSDAFKTVKLFIKAANVLKKYFPEYAEFSKGFGVQYHMKAILSINKNMNQEEIAADINNDSMIDSGSVVDVKNPAGDNDSFLPVPPSQ